MRIGQASVAGCRCELVCAVARCCGVRRAAARGVPVGAAARGVPVGAAARGVPVRAAARGVPVRRPRRPRPESVSSRYGVAPHAHKSSNDAPECSGQSGLRLAPGAGALGSRPWRGSARIAPLSRRGAGWGQRSGTGQRCRVPVTRSPPASAATLSGLSAIIDGNPDRVRWAAPPIRVACDYRLKHGWRFLNLPLRPAYG
jgi:hypothetical protein